MRSYTSQLGNFPKARGVRGALGDLGLRIGDLEDDEAFEGSSDISKDPGFRLLLIRGIL